MLSSSLTALVNTLVGDLLNVFGQIGAIESSRLGLVPFRPHGGIVAFHPVSAKESLELFVPTFQHGQNLGVRPRVHGHRTNFARVHSVGSVSSTALQTNESPVGNTGPLWTRCSTVGAGGVPRQRKQQFSTRCGKEVVVLCMKRTTTSPAAPASDRLQFARDRGDESFLRVVGFGRHDRLCVCVCVRDGPALEPRVQSVECTS